MKRVIEGVYRLEAAGFVNVYLVVGGADLTLIDAGHSRSAEGLLTELRDNGFDFKDVARIIVTHAHADHAGGLHAFLEKRRIKVYAHPKTVPILTGKVPMPSARGVRGFCRDFLCEQLLPWKPIEAAVALETGTPLRGIPQWQVLQTPGHTEGSISLFHPAAQVLICGDVLSNRGGRLHAMAPVLHEDPKTLRVSIEGLSKLDVDILCCGHGPVLRGGAFRYIEAVLVRR